MEIEQQIQQEAHRARVAFEAFKGLYAATNPPPAVTVFQPENQWIKAALAVVLIASMIVSGSHTIPTFAGGDNVLKAIIGVAGFFMLEVSIVAFEFIRTQRHYRVAREEPATLNIFLIAGLGLALMVLLTVQVEYMLTQGGIVIHDNVRLFILVSMAIGAPLLAFFTGGILAMYSVMDRVQLRRHTEAHEVEMQQWEEELRRSWQANKAKFGGRVQVRVERPDVPEIAAVNDVNLVNLRKFTTERPSHKLQKAIDWLEPKPEYWQTPSRELVDIMGLGISHMTINKAQRIVRGEES